MKSGESKKRAKSAESLPDRGPSTGPQPPAVPDDGQIGPATEKKLASSKTTPEIDPQASSPGEVRGPQDLLLKAVSAGLSGVFATQESLRKAVGDAVPAQWSEFASEQTDRARADLLDRISDQIAVAIQDLDAADVLTRLLSDHTVEVSATIRLKPIEDEGGKKKKADDISLNVNSLKTKT